MLSSKKKQQMQESLRTLAATHAATIAQIEETMAVLIRTLELDGPSSSDQTNRPIADEDTFCITWRGHTCFLGNTLLFWLFHRLNQSVDRYVSHMELMDDVWRGVREASTIRGVAKRLRDRLMPRLSVRQEKAFSSRSISPPIPAARC